MSLAEPRLSSYKSGVSGLAADGSTIELPLHRLTVEQYDAMTRTGILGPDDRVELIEGLLVRKMGKNPPHRIATRKARVSLEKVVGDGWYVDTQEPIVTSDSEPEPDVCVIKGRTEDYADANPPASSVGLVVEVADATLLRDRRTKARLYARAGIPTYWIVNLKDRVVEVHTEPSEDAPDEPRYRTVRTLESGSSAIVNLDGADPRSVAVADLLP